MTPPTQSAETCSLCPRLCRPACPVASGSGREAAVPSLIAATLVEWGRGRLPVERALEAATLCVDCGACQSHCHLDRPLPELLRKVRREIVVFVEPEALQPIEGEGAMIVIEADERPFAAALSRRLKRPVRRWPTTDRLGVGAVEHADWEKHAEKLRLHKGAGADLVIADGGVATALSAAGIPFRWLQEVVPELPSGVASCCAPGGTTTVACCGAAGPLMAHHPEDSVRVGEFWLRRTESRQVSDARCRAHLQACGGKVRDALDVLLEGE